MSEMATIARPYAKAAFEYAVENKAVDAWQQMLFFAAEVATNDQVKQLLSGAMATDKLGELFANICGEQLDQNGQNFIKVLAENGRLQGLPAILSLFNGYKADYEKEADVEVTSAVELTEKQKKRY